jgi:hypothetical protein
MNRPPMHQLPARTFVLDDRDIVRLARLTLAGLPIVERRDGATLGADRELVAALVREAERLRTQQRRQSGRPRHGCATEQALDVCGTGSFAPSGWLSVKEAARQYEVSDTYLRRLRQTGRIAGRLKPGGGYELDPASLTAWSIGRPNRST